MLKLLLSCWPGQWILVPVAACRMRPSRIGRVLLPLVLVLSFCLSVLASPVSSASKESRVLPQLQRQAAEQSNKTFRVIVLRINGDRAADRALQALGGTRVKEVTAGGFVALLPGRAIRALGEHPAVKYVTPDARMNKTSTVDPSKLGTVYPFTVKATELWSNTSSPLTGKGVGVAVLDTGINGGACDWKNASGASRIVAQAKFNSNTNSQADGHGHGTHVAGIIAGNSWHCTNTAVQGKYVGIAPGANLINVKVSDDQGGSYLSDVANGIDWVVNNRATYNIRVMNLSLVSSVAESYNSSVLAAAVERAWKNGIFVVVAAGNAGPDTVHYPPANDPFVVTVGAVDPMNTGTLTDDFVPSWSSYGTTQDGFSKPDVAAPGRYVIAPLASSGSTLGKQFPSRIVDTNWFWLSGTSMASPVVAGLAALAFEAHPAWTPDQVKWLLQNTSAKLGSSTSSVLGQGAGQVDAAAVVRYSGTPGSANQGLTLSSLLTTSTDGTLQVDYTASSWSASSWSSSNFATLEFDEMEEEEGVE